MKWYIDLSDCESKRDTSPNPGMYTVGLIFYGLSNRELSGWDPQSLLICMCSNKSGVLLSPSKYTHTFVKKSTKLWHLIILIMSLSWVFMVMDQEGPSPNVVWGDRRWTVRPKIDCVDSQFPRSFFIERLSDSSSNCEGLWRRSSWVVIRVERVKRDLPHTSGCFTGKCRKWSLWYRVLRTEILVFSDPYMFRGI